MRINSFLKRPAKRFLGTVLIVTVLLLFSDKILMGIGKYLYPTDYGDYVEKYCAEYNVDKSFCYALIKCESNFKPDAKSNAGAFGLMQLTEDTYLWLTDKIYGESKSTEYITDPETNIQCGIWYVSYLKKEFTKDDLVIAAYNAGPVKVREWLADPEYSRDGLNLEYYPYGETEKHVKKVLKAQQIYLKLYDFNKEN